MNELLNINRKALQEAINEEIIKRVKQNPLFFNNLIEAQINVTDIINNECTIYVIDNNNNQSIIELNLKLMEQQDVTLIKFTIKQGDKKYESLINIIYYKIYLILKETNEYFILYHLDQQISVFTSFNSIYDKEIDEELLTEYLTSIHFSEQNQNWMDLFNAIKRQRMEIIAANIEANTKFYQEIKYQLNHFLSIKNYLITNEHTSLECVPDMFWQDFSSRFLTHDNQFNIYGELYELFYMFPDNLLFINSYYLFEQSNADNPIQLLDENHALFIKMNDIEKLESFIERIKKENNLNFLLSDNANKSLPNEMISYATKDNIEIPYPEYFNEEIFAFAKRNHLHYLKVFTTPLTPKYTYQPIQVKIENISIESEDENGAFILKDATYCGIITHYYEITFWVTKDGLDKSFQIINHSPAQ